MRSPLLGSLVAMACWLAASSGAVAHAQDARSAAAATEADNKQQAQAHFAKAQEHYQEGNYPDARRELEEAHRLDPTAKELLFNLGILCEKMQEYDAAIAHFREYAALSSVTAEERAKSDVIIRRIEGAKKSVKPKDPEVIVKTVEVPKVAAPEPPSRGRIDAATIAAGVVTILGAGVGATFGVLAMGANPGSGTITGGDYAYSRFAEDRDRAKTFALVSDVGIATAIVGAVTTAILYFARTKSPSAAAPPKDDVRDAPSKAARLLPAFGPHVTSATGAAR